MILQGHPGTGDTIVEGKVIVANDNFSARYDLDLETGLFARPSHKLYGQSFSGKIIALNIAKGGVASAWMLRILMQGNHRPLALLLNSANPIMAQGAVFAGMPLIDRFQEDITKQLNEDDRVRIDSKRGTVEVLGHETGT